MVQVVHQESQVQVELVEHQVQVVHQVLLVHQELVVHQVLQELVERQVNLLAGLNY